MQAPVRYCAKCGHANQAQFQFCASCSSPLPPVMSAPPPMVMSMPPPGFAWTPYGWKDFEREKQIDRTKTGAMLLMIGFAISWVPLVGAIGGLMVFIALFFMALGRKAFGPAHARNVILGVILWIVGILLVVVVAVVGVFSIIGGVGAGGSPPTPQEWLAYFDMIFVGAMIGGAVGGLMSVLFGLSLSEKNGKILLVLGYIASIVVTAALFLWVRQSILELVQNTPTVDAIQRISNQTTLLSLGSVIPNAMYALAYFLIYNRIKRGEIPGPAQPLMAMPGFPGTVPTAASGGPAMPSSQPPSMPPSSPPGTPPGPGTGP